MAMGTGSLVAGLLLLAACVADAQYSTPAAPKAPPPPAQYSGPSAPPSTTLKTAFYDKSCHDAESIVFDEVRKAWNDDINIPARLLRLHFHDCFVNGCDASVLLDSSVKQAEKDAPPNKSLGGYEVIDKIKARLEGVCKQTVSCADILAYAARDSVKVMTGGYYYAVPGGRPDGTVSKLAMTSDLPPHNVRNGDQLVQNYFTKKGLSYDDWIVLSGAHTLGITYCRTFDYRLMNDNDKGMNATFRNELRRQCNYNGNNFVALDTGSQNKFDTSYYANVLANRTVLESDAALNTPRAVSRVRQLKDNKDLFLYSFANSMGRMGSLKTSNPGKVRDTCRKVRM